MESKAKTVLSMVQHAQKRARAAARVKAHEAMAAFRWAAPRRKKAHSLPAPLVVSLTSYPPRFGTLHHTLKCLATQSVSPDRIVLWIADEDASALPVSVYEIAMRGGIEIRKCADTKSYKKIIPLLKSDSEAFVVTADDDVYYPKNWLKELTDAFDGDTSVVLCHRAHEIALDEAGLPMPYDRWNFDVLSATASPLVFPTGVGGVLYPPGIFHSHVTSIEMFQRLCPNADDVWLYWMARLGGATFKKVGRRRLFVDWAGTQGHALWLQNLAGGSNDLRIRAMVSEFGFREIGSQRDN